MSRIRSIFGETKREHEFHGVYSSVRRLIAISQNAVEIRWEAVNSFANLPGVFSHWITHNQALLDFTIFAEIFFQAV